MIKAIHQKLVRQEREKLIQELDEIYTKAFGRLQHLEVEERTLAKLVQLILLSKDAAITTLQKEVEVPIITQAPKNQ